MPRWSNPRGASIAGPVLLGNQPTKRSGPGLKTRSLRRDLRDARTRHDAAVQLQPLSAPGHQTRLSSSGGTITARNAPDFASRCVEYALRSLLIPHETRQRDRAHHKGQYGHLDLLAPSISPSSTSKCARIPSSNGRLTSSLCRAASDPNATRGQPSAFSPRCPGEPLRFEGEGDADAGPRSAGGSHPPGSPACSGVKKINILGERPEQIFVEFSFAKLATLGVSAQDIAAALQRQNTVTPAGSIDCSEPKPWTAGKLPRKTLLMNGPVLGDQSDQSRTHGGGAGHLVSTSRHVPAAESSSTHPVAAGRGIRRHRLRCCAP